MSSATTKSVQEMQDDIFRKMTPQKKLRLASGFSMFLLRLNKLGKNNGLRKTYRRGRQNT